ncbi:MAG: sulfotransferase family protein [Pseudomonadota bacterium]
MALEVIGAGFGRNGTESLKRALEMLGFGPCYHMYEVLPYPDRVDLWREAARGNLPDWDEAFAGFRATVDWPGAFFWRELSAHFPQAKIILSVRSPEDWYASMETTILKVLRESTNPDTVGSALVARRVFGNRLDDKEHILSAYARNTRQVQAAFGPERLLTYELGAGWEPLCAFLDRAVPHEPYPSGNRAEAFYSRLGDIADQRATRNGA